MYIREPVWTINEAPWDRVLRIVIGLAILAFVFVGPKTPWGFLGLVPLVTGVLGISSCRRRGPPSTRDPLAS